MTTSYNLQTYERIDAAWRRNAEAIALIRAARSDSLRGIPQRSEDLARTDRELTERVALAGARGEPLEELSARYPGAPLRLVGGLYAAGAWHARAATAEALGAALDLHPSTVRRLRVESCGLVAWPLLDDLTGSARASEEVRRGLCVGWREYRRLVVLSLYLAGVTTRYAHHAIGGTYSGHWNYLALLGVRRYRDA